MNKNKGEIMNNLKKLGLSALAGSLVAVSAQAGELSVTGAANVTVKSGAAANSGKFIGSDRDVAFNGSGELDNGWTVGFTTAMKDSFAVSSSVTSVTMGSMGTLSTGDSWGGVSSKYDEETPQAYEQTSDAAANSSNYVGSMLDNNAIAYNSAEYSMEGVTVSFDAEYSMQADDVYVNDGGGGTHSNTVGEGYGLGITAKAEGATFGAYVANVKDISQKKIDSVDDASDNFGATVYAKYSIGAASFGYQQSYVDAGKKGVADVNTTAKVIGTAQGIYEADTASIAYNVNDDLSISYSITNDIYDAQSPLLADVKQKTDAVQVAYSMGSMSLKAYNMQVSNPGHDSDAIKLSVTEIALGLSF